MSSLEQEIETKKNLAIAGLCENLKNLVIAVTELIEEHIEKEKNK